MTRVTPSLAAGLAGQLARAGVAGALARGLQAALRAPFDTAELAASLAEALAFNPDQPRDEKGRWTSDGDYRVHPETRKIVHKDVVEKWRKDQKGKEKKEKPAKKEPKPRQNPKPKAPAKPADQPKSSIPPKAEKLLQRKLDAIDKGKRGAEYEYHAAVAKVASETGVPAYRINREMQAQRNPDLGKFERVATVKEPPPTSAKYRSAQAETYKALPQAVQQQLELSRVKIANAYDLHAASEVAGRTPSGTPRGWRNGDWSQAEGYYDPTSKTVVSVQASKRYGASMEDSDRTEGVLRHEVGHAVDEIPRNMLFSGMPGMTDGTKFSATPQFKAAWEQDLAAMSEPQKALYDYYTKNENPNFARSEAFAEVFGAVMGGGGNTWSTPLDKVMPATAKVVREIVASL